MLKFIIKPVDVLFFGDGKPFNLGGLGESIFPPFPNSIASAIFAKIYAKTNITGDVYKAVYGPFLEKVSEKVSEEEPYYFPAPANIIKQKDGKDQANMIEQKDGKNKKDGKNEIIEQKVGGKKIIIYDRIKSSKLVKVENTDLGDRVEYISWIKPKSEEKNNQISTQKYEPFRGFISLKGLKSWYNSGSIDETDLLTETDVFDIEDRVSIHMDDYTGTVKEEDGLYKVRFIRLKEEFRLVFWVEFKEEHKKKIIEILNKSPKVLKIGGEAKTAFYDIEEHNFKDLFKDLTFNPNEKCEKTCTILFLTPGVFEGKNSILEQFKGIKYACLTGYTLLSINSRNYGNRFIRAVNPGSLFVIENESLNELITFYKPSKEFIGANLVLVKTF